MKGIERCRNALSDQPLSLASRAGLRIAGTPAELLHAEAVSFRQLALGELVTRGGICLGFIDSPKFAWIHAKGISEFVNRRLKRKASNRLTGSTHQRIRNGI